MHEILAMKKPYLFICGILNIFLFAGLISCETTQSSNSSSTTSSSSNSTSTDLESPPQSGSPAFEPANNSIDQTGRKDSDVGLTAGEIIAGMDRELDESIAVFDGMILDERAKVEAAATGSYEQSDADSGDSGEALFEEGDLEEGLPGYGDFPETVSDNESSDSSDGAVDGEYADTESDGQGSSAPSSTTPGGIPEDIDDGRNDDIVARQIREAAQKEKDPALREKLWDEYRKYKNQQRRD